MATRKHWYAKWWGILILAFLAVVILLLLVFFLYVGKLVKDIRAGKISSASVKGTSLVANANSGTATRLQGASTALAANDDPFLGPKTAKVTVVEFSDFQCPFCRQSFPIVRELEATYRNKIRIVYRDFPITQIHQFAFKAAEAGQCANEQGKFWAYHDKLFTNQERLDILSLKEYARQVGLNELKFNNCLDSGKFAGEVQADFDDGLALGVSGTPTWFINNKRVVGVISLEDFKKIVDAELAKQ